MGGSTGRQLSNVISREANSGSVDSLTPLERAVIYPGKCCVCAKVIPTSVIRCNEHEEVYQRARQWDRNMPGGRP